MEPPERNPGLERVGFELRADGIKDSERNPLRSGIHTRGYLPHVKREGASYFVTFRLADSLPQKVLMQFEAERANRLRLLAKPERGGEESPEDEETINRDFRRKIEKYLDAGHGSCYLRIPAAADLVANTLLYFHGQRYLLREWVVMPNHVHVIVWPMPNFLLSSIVKTWKQYSSRHIKELLKLGPGPFWQREPYDHWIREEEEYDGIARYIRFNPVKARLCQTPEQWRWSSAHTVTPPLRRLGA